MTDLRLVSRFTRLSPVPAPIGLTVRGRAVPTYSQVGALRLLLPISIALVLVGCNVEDRLSSTSQSLVIHNRLSSNRLSSNRLSSNHLASSRLDGAQSQVFRQVITTFVHP